MSLEEKIKQIFEKYHNCDWTWEEGEAITLNAFGADILAVVKDDALRIKELEGKLEDAQKQMIKINRWLENEEKEHEFWAEKCKELEARLEAFTNHLRKFPKTAEGENRDEADLWFDELVVIAEKKGEKP